jgi:hypothetical protein
MLSPRVHSRGIRFGCTQRRLLPGRTRSAYVHVVLAMIYSRVFRDPDALVVGMLYPALVVLARIAGFPELNDVVARLQRRWCW